MLSLLARRELRGVLCSRRLGGQGSGRVCGDFWRGARALVWLGAGDRHPAVDQRDAALDHGAQLARCWQVLTASDMSQLGPLPHCIIAALPQELLLFVQGLAGPETQAAMRFDGSHLTVDLALACGMGHTPFHRFRGCWTGRMRQRAPTRQNRLGKGRCGFYVGVDARILLLWAQATNQSPVLIWRFNWRAKSLAPPPLRAWV